MFFVEPREKKTTNGHPETHFEAYDFGSTFMARKEQILHPIYRMIFLNVTSQHQVAKRGDSAAPRLQRTCETILEPRAGPAVGVPSAVSCVPQIPQILILDMAIR